MPACATNQLCQDGMKYAPPHGDPAEERGSGKEAHLEVMIRIPRRL
jgi:hypothetical protein